MNGGTEGRACLLSMVIPESWATQEGLNSCTPSSPCRELQVIRGKELLHSKQRFKPAFLCLLCQAACCGQVSTLLFYCHHSHQDPGLYSPLQNSFFPHNLLQVHLVGRGRNEVSSVQTEGRDATLFALHPLSLQDKPTPCESSQALSSTRGGVRMAR